MFPCWGARPLRLICLHFVSVYPSPSAVMGEIIEPTPPPMLIWALFRVEISLSCTGRHSRKLKTLHKEGTSGERCKCKIDTQHKQRMSSGCYINAKIALLYFESAFCFLMLVSCFSRLCEVEQYYDPCLREGLGTGVGQVVLKRG